jgi:hypothetical protein
MYRLGFVCKTTTKNKLKHEHNPLNTTNVCKMHIACTGSSLQGPVQDWLDRLRFAQLSRVSEFCLAHFSSY